ncbi:putative bifunctional diguanylate cyclase/phosphodiesterase [Flocculibacter collagenilyticus]|uniref:putative bifunctional diguanylate cyclase/phosphodiesterase n=1 Tax=Flocculibacter collagenilyticus TaxID=2744479 RepID=UPI0018F3EB0D|nr:GGDEF domain-containing phosphodiesterase [Flocculibacter collagenilyticus]
MSSNRLFTLLIMLFGSLFTPSAMAQTLYFSPHLNGLLVGALATLSLIQILQLSKYRSELSLFASVASIASVVLIAIPLKGAALLGMAVVVYVSSLLAIIFLFKKGKAAVKLVSILLVLLFIAVAGMVYLQMVEIRLITIANLLLSLLVLFNIFDQLKVERREIEAIQRNTTAELYNAYHDPTTGLPNRLKLTQVGDKLIQQPQADYALLVIKVLNFEKINLALGHANGNLLLTQLAERLKMLLANEARVVTLDYASNNSQDASASTDANTPLNMNTNVASLGNVDFAILMDSADKQHLAEQVYHRLVHALQEPLVLQSCTLDFEFAGGIAKYPAHGHSIEQLLGFAHTALENGRKDKAQAVIFDPTLLRHTEERLAIMAELREAIEQNSLQLYIQPQVNLINQAVVGAELFVRWHHPAKGLIPADEFAELAEQTGVIFPLTQWLIHQATATLSELKKASLTSRIALNISCQELLNDDLAETIEDACELAGINQSQLGLEIAERALLGKPQSTKDVLTRLHGRGVRLSIDDFGKGYSSLSYLSDIPLHEVKIDCSFIGEQSKAEHSNAITGAVIDIARNLSLDVLAEGIESEEIANKLKSMGCTLGQGFYFSQPIELAGFVSWLTQWNKRHSSGVSAE